MLLQKSFASLTGGRTIFDVTLTGTARRIAGSDDETGTATLKALATGESRMDLSFPLGQRTEIHANSDNGPIGSWSGTDSAPHVIPQHNLLIQAAWFFPAFAIARGLGPSYVPAYIGHETWNSAAAEHVVICSGFTNPSQFPAILQHLSQQDIYLDSSTFLPLGMTFNTHPDDVTTVDIPLEIRLSDYRPVNGGQVPFRVQRYMNNSLTLDLQFQQALINTGVPASAFSVQ